MKSFIMNIKINILMAFLIIDFVTYECQRFIDKFSKAGPIVDKFCRRYGSCEEGTHVMCRYYDPNNRFGPLCHYAATNITLHRDQKEFILTVVNEIRSRISGGKTNFSDGTALPKAYGLQRLSWDDELAEYAQLWANQCNGFYDLCRATSKFPDPGQFVIKNRFSILDWTPAFYTKTVFFDEHVISDEKVNYVAYMKIRQAYYEALAFLSPDMFKPSSSENPLFVRAPAVNFLFGIQTHMGCGVSVYKEYNYNNDEDRTLAVEKNLFNIIELVCNFSERLPKDGILYPTEPPIGSDECGCPPGYSGDSNCLCSEDCQEHCKNIPDLVVLPIFKFEEAAPRDVINYRDYAVTPHDKLLSRDQQLEMEGGFVVVEGNDLSNTVYYPNYENVSYYDEYYYEYDTENIQNETLRKRSINNENSKVEEVVSDLLNQLDDKVDNIDMSETEKEEIHNSIASIFKILEYKTKSLKDGNGRRQDVKDKINNFNTPIQIRQLKGVNLSSPKILMSDKFRNTHDIQGHGKNNLGNKNEDETKKEVDRLLSYQNREEYRQRENF